MTECLMACPDSANKLKAVSIKARNGLKWRRRYEILILILEKS